MDGTWVKAPTPQQGSRVESNKRATLGARVVSIIRSMASCPTFPIPTNGSISVVPSKDGDEDCSTSTSLIIAAEEIDGVNNSVVFVCTKIVFTLLRVSAYSV